MATGPIYTFVTFVTFQPCYIAASQSLIIALGRPTAVTGQLRRKQAPNLAPIHRILQEPPVVYWSDTLHIFLP